MPDQAHLTPDGRYIVVRERLWRASDPSLDSERCQALIDELMSARREIGVAMEPGDGAGERAARATNLQRAEKRDQVA